MTPLEKISNLRNKPYGLRDGDIVGLKDERNDPGCKLDDMVVLESAKGILWSRPHYDVAGPERKSRGREAVLRIDYHSDSDSDDDGDDDDDNGEIGFGGGGGKK